MNRRNYSFLSFSHILLCNILTTILRPNFEDPLDTAKQLVEKNITLYDIAQIWKQFLLESPIKEYKILGKNMIIANDYDHFDYISKNYVIREGTHAYMGGSLLPFELAMGRWYRSQEKVAGDYPFGGYLTNKKWHLNEVMINSLSFIY